MYIIRKNVDVTSHRVIYELCVYMYNVYIPLQCMYSCISTGKCYLATNKKTLVQAMESLTQKLHPGVVINFQKIGGSSPNSSIGLGSKDVSRSNTPLDMEIGKYTLHC